MSLFWYRAQWVQHANGWLSINTLDVPLHHRVDILSTNLIAAHELARATAKSLGIYTHMSLELLGNEAEYHEYLFQSTIGKITLDLPIREA